MIPDLNPEMKDMIEAIGHKSMFYGNVVPESVMRQFEIEEDDLHIGILVPFWLPVLEKGRGPRKSNRDTELWKRIFAWMGSRNMFRTVTEEGRIREAKFITWYINKYGNKHFRSKQFVDIYTSVRAATIEKINQKFSNKIGEITMEVI